MSTLVRSETAPTVASAPRAVAAPLRWWRELILVGLLYLIYDGSRLLPEAGRHTADRNAGHVLGLERSLHLTPEPWLNSGLHGLAVVPVIAALFYETLHYLITPIVLIWMYRTHAPDYRRARTWLAVMTMIGLLGFLFFPVTPPRLYDPSRFYDIVAESHNWGWWSAHGEAPRGLGSMVNEFAAMPSLHVGWALWCGVLLIRFARHTTLRVLGAVYPVVTALVVMATGNHYLLDVVGGVVVAALSRAIVSGVVRWLHRRHRPEPADG
jgi:hypothetical protein